MTNKEILVKAIQKAIDGGWSCFGTDLERWDWQIGEGTSWPLHMSFTPNESVGMITYISQVFDANRIIFNHDFAKALWGVSEHTTLPGIDSYGEEDCEHCEANIWDSIPHYCWQYHIQQMVIADDPIKYLGENI